MSIFNSILEKLGMKKPAQPAAPAKPAAETRPAPQVPPVVSSAPPSTHVFQPAPQVPPATAPIRDFRPAAPATPSTPVPSAPVPVTPAPIPMPAQYVVPPAPAAPAPAQPAPIPMVDVVSKLEQMAAHNPQQLDWKVSIVDLLKLLDLDSSYAARKELATELGCPADKMNDSAQMNTWLHKTVLQKLAENGGNIPKELLD